MRLAVTFCFPLSYLVSAVQLVWGGIPLPPAAATVLTTVQQSNQGACVLQTALADCLSTHSTQHPNTAEDKDKE